MKNTTTLLYIIIGLLLMILVSHFYYVSSSQTQIKRNGYRTQQSGSMMHQMPNGTTMGDQATIDTTMNGMMSGLTGKTGDDFDKAFLSEMIVHHQGAVDMAQAVLKNSKRPELIKLANDIIKAQTGEITIMQNWQKSWFTK
jgi:uncharacterized protein (DUF305 family)